MLKAITIENFKSFGKKQSLPLAPLTLMIGANASGKSNAIEAFRFLSFLAEGQKLSAIQHNIDDSNKIFRGSSRDLGHHGANEFTLGCEIDDEWNKFLITLGEKNNKFQILKEALLGREAFPYMYKTCSLSEIFDIYNQRQKDEDFEQYIGVKVGITQDKEVKPSTFLNSNMIMEQLGHRTSIPTPQDLENRKGYASFRILLGTSRILKLLTDILYIDPIPSTMRGDDFPAKKLENDCSNLAGVLQVLWEKDKNRKPLLSFIQSLPEQNFTDIKFHDDRRGRYFFELIETFGGEERPVLGELLSDGTLRVLAVAAALLTAPEGSTVVIEEVDNGIHPSRAHDLMALMLEKAKQRNIRLLLTTHNPALMDALPDEALGDVVFSYRDPEQGDSRLVRLSDLDDYESLVFQGPLGDLVTRGVVDRFVKNPVSAEEKKKKALEWLEQMRGVGE